MVWDMENGKFPHADSVATIYHNFLLLSFTDMSLNSTQFPKFFITITFDFYVGIHCFSWFLLYSVNVRILGY